LHVDPFGIFSGFLFFLSSSICFFLFLLFLPTFSLSTALKRWMNSSPVFVLGLFASLPSFFAIKTPPLLSSRLCFFPNLGFPPFRSVLSDFPVIFSYSHLAVESSLISNGVTFFSPFFFFLPPLRGFLRGLNDAPSPQVSDFWMCHGMTCLSLPAPPPSPPLLLLSSISRKFPIGF